MGFLVIPALDLKSGKCVQLEGGMPEKKLVELEDPLAIAREWEGLGAKRLHLVDLDRAIEGSTVNTELVEDILRGLSIPVQYGGGIRSFEQASSFLEAGAEKVILGTLAIEEPEVLEELRERYGRERLIVALDSRDGCVVIRGWRESTRVRASSLAERFRHLAGEFLFTNVNVEGGLKGIEEESIGEVVRAAGGRVLVSGGISSIEDIQRVKALGARGAVVGSALYTGRVDFARARELED